MVCSLGSKRRSFGGIGRNTTKPESRPLGLTPLPLKNKRKAQKQRDSPSASSPPGFIQCVSSLGKVWGDVAELGTGKRTTEAPSCGLDYERGQRNRRQHEQNKLSCELAQGCYLAFTSGLSFENNNHNNSSSWVALSWRLLDNQHQEHQLGRVLARDRQMASIISIGWVAI